MTLQPVADPRVWRHVRLMYVSAGLLFLVNILFGFMNVINSGTDGGIAHWQVVTHLHSGTVGWITFSILATAVWIFTGQREVSAGYAAKVGFLAWFALVAFAGYMASFAIAFHFEGDYWSLLPVFGTASALVIWSGFGYTLVQVRNQPVVSTPHLLLTGALGIASLGALMGVLLGLGHALPDFIVPGSDPIGQHAGVMDSYFLLGLSGILEALVLGTVVRRTKGGITQTTFWVLTGLVTFAALYVGREEVAGIALLLVVAGLVTYLVRMARHTFSANPFRGDTSVGVFWAGLWLPVYVLLFVSLITMFIRGVVIPDWFWVMFQHTLFVGVATQVILIAMSALALYRPVAREVVTAGFWLINLGMIAFFAGEYAAGVAHGAALMGIGILAGLFACWGRMMGPGAPVAG